MKLLIFTVILLLSRLSLAASCPNEPIVKSGDSFEHSASIYLVCPSFGELSDQSARKLILELLQRHEGVANEVFIVVLKTDSSVGFMEKEPYRPEKGELIGDFYNISGKLFLFRETPKEREINVRPKLGDY